MPILVTSENEVVKVDDRTEDLFFVGHGAMYPALLGAPERTFKDGSSGGGAAR